ncbi:MAG: HlyD family efflux transporter periplasmic adaptor subunit [Oscillospiraceae bacterium]
MNSYTIKILVFFLSLFILCTISSQIYFAFQDDYKTETAIAFTAEEKANFKGIYVRNEKVLNYEGSGVVGYPYPDGSKIGKDSVVAVVYNSESDITANEKIENLTNELELLKKVQNPGTTEVAQPEYISNLIDEKYQLISSLIEKDDIKKISIERNELLSLMNIMQIVVNKETNYNVRIAEIEAEIASLKAQQVPPIINLSVTDPGYFVSYVDGFETSLSLDKINDITVKDIKRITSDKEANTPKKTSSIGKIIDGYDWKMIGIIDNTKNYFKKDTTVKLKVSSSSKPFNAQIIDIKDTENPQESIIILACEKLTHDLVQRRVETVEILSKNVDGIKVPRNSIRFKDGQKGVYIKLGEKIIFKKIDVLFEGDDYVVSAKTDKAGYLLLYDDIVVEGINANGPAAETSEEVQTEEPPLETTVTEATNSQGEIIVGDKPKTVTTSSEKAVTSGSVEND